MRDAWAAGQELAVRGWIYGLKDGLLRDLQCTGHNPTEAARCYRAAVDSI